MNKLILLLLSCLVLCVGINGQTATDTQTAATQTKTEAKPKRQIFRANKNQITEVQKMLKTKGIYTGEATGKLDDPTRASIKSYQKDNGLKQTGTLNRATLEKMGIELTDKQKLIPISPNSYATASDKSDSPKPKRVIFRATKDQIADAQKLLKEKGMYSGDETGKLDDATRDGLKKFQEANGVKVTGTLNRVTLEKMGIELTDKQKGTPAETK
ncbi:MAG TPA: peptidoglycan-binding domain-containing protein [Pyrinomonadaceae bacterium]|nr:peptidoglycan-binding domain-containing protein [Pyrinomonadaceae bacterium]